MWPSISPLSLLCHLKLILFTSASFFTLISVFCFLILSIVRCFWTSGDSQKEIHVYLYSLGAFSSFSVYFLPLSSACCGQKTKSADSFILSCLCNYNMLITLTQLGLHHSLNNQASDITPPQSSWLRRKHKKRNNEVLDRHSLKIKLQGSLYKKHWAAAKASWCLCGHMCADPQSLE